MDLSKLGYPKEVINTVNELRADIEIDKHSHKGGNGYVIFGYHKLLKKRVALKFYYYGTDSHEEVQLLSQIQSSNIIKILNARTVENGFAFFMTEEILGGDIDNLIESPFLSLKLAVDVTRGILNGVGDMHKDENRLLHRDLKPANILIDENNNPLIADFGSVKKIPQNADFVNGSRHAALYRPPESYHNEYERKSDLYQIGLVLYQLLGGFLPYDGETYLKPGERKKYLALTSEYDKSKFIDSVLEKKAKKGNLIDLKSLPPFVDTRLKKIINKATHPDSDRRYNDVAEFDHALHKLGILPDWRYTDNEFMLQDYQGRDFKVIHKKKGIFICQKSRTNQDNWRKEGKIVEGNEMEVVLDMMKKIIKN